MYRIWGTTNMEVKNKMRMCWLTIVMLFALVFMGSDAYCEALTQKEILLYADAARGNYDGIKWKLRISSVEGGRQQNRRLDIKGKGSDFFAILTAPPKVRGQILLNVDYNMWFAKPGLSKPVPVSPRQKLVGGASYGDIAATNYSEDYEAELMKEEMVNGEWCYVFDLKAVTKKVTYDRIKYWVSKGRLVGVKAEFFTVSGKKFKSAVFEYEHETMILEKRRPFISKMIIKDLFLEGNITTMTFSEPLIGKIPDSAFSLHLLMLRTI